MKRRAARAPVLIVGSGRLGGALARQLRGAGWPVWGLPRSPASSRRWRALGIHPADSETLQRALLVFLAVPDEAVAGVAHELAPLISPRTPLVHCAGALALEPLRHAAPTHPIGSFHPLCAVSSPREALTGHVAISASTASLRRTLRRLSRSLGLAPLPVPERSRAAYHAAAVMAAGGVVSTLAAAAAIWRQAGIPPTTSRRALVELTRSALAGVEKRGFLGGLTGPIVRKDAERLAAHVAALAPSQRPLYIALARAGLSLTKPVLSPQARRRLTAAMGHPLRPRK